MRDWRKIFKKNRRITHLLFSKNYRKIIYFDSGSDSDFDFDPLVAAQPRSDENACDFACVRSPISVSPFVRAERNARVFLNL